MLELKEIASKNQVFRSFIGWVITASLPARDQRSILENPVGTPPHPYQPEIAQGRLGGAAGSDYDH